jgi:hypothetical protein
MLNGSTLNGSALNGDYQLLNAYGDGEGAIAYVAEGEGLRLRHFNVLSVASFAGELQASAIRYSTFSANAVLVGQLDASAQRVGFSYSPVISFESSLYYTKTAFGSGNAIVEIGAAGYVGIVFIDGEAVLVYAGEGDGLRAKTGGGSAIASMVGQTDDYLRAIRVPMPAATAYSPFAAELDSAHIHAGVVYKDGFGNAVLSLLAEDGGMRRQVFLTSMDIDSAGSLLGTTRQHASGSAVSSIVLAEAFRIERCGYGDLILALPPELAADIFVRGAGSAAATVAANFQAGAVRRAELVGEAEISAALSGLRAKTSPASAVLLSAAELAALRTQRANGVAVLYVPVAMDRVAVIDLEANDIDRQQFYRSATERYFARAARATTWERG